jgi:NitT/TauT family transport system permease protein
MPFVFLNGRWEDEMSEYSKAKILISKSDQIRVHKSLDNPSLVNRLTDQFKKMLLIIIIFILWEILPKIGVVDPFICPTFIQTIQATINLILSGELLIDIKMSLFRAFTGFILAVLFAIPAGILIGRVKKADEILSPLLEFFRSTPAMALYPVFMLFLGLGEVSKVALITFGSLWPTLLNTISGTKEVDPLLIKAARSMGISKIGLLIKIVLPSIVPSVITGLRLSLSSAIMMVIAAEMLNANKGLAFMIVYYESKFESDRMFAGIICIALIGLLFNYAMVELEKHISKWKEAM